MKGQSQQHAIDTYWFYVYYCGELSFYRLFVCAACDQYVEVSLIRVMIRLVKDYNF